MIKKSGMTGARNANHFYVDIEPFSRVFVLAVSSLPPIRKNVINQQTQPITF